MLRQYPGFCVRPDETISSRDGTGYSSWNARFAGRPSTAIARPVRTRSGQRSPSRASSSRRSFQIAFEHIRLRRHVRAECVRRETGPNADLVVLRDRLRQAIQARERLGLVQHHLGESDHLKVLGTDRRRVLRAFVVAVVLAERDVASPIGSRSRRCKGRPSAPPPSVRRRGSSSPFR